MKLLYRGKKYEDEFLTDYVQRISDKNGFSSVGKFRRVLFQYYRNNNGDVVQLRSMAVSRVSLELLLKINIPIDHYNRWLYGSGSGRWHRVKRICLSCWNEQKYIKFYWWLKAYEKCHLHHEQLIYMSGPNEECESTNNNGKFSSIIYLAIKRYSAEEFFQGKLLDELDMANCDLMILNGIEKNFGFDYKVLGAIANIKDEWSSGLFIGKRADSRIETIAEFLSVSIGSKDFWLRIIALSVLSNKKGLFFDLPYSSAQQSFSKACQYILYSDPTMPAFTKAVEDFWGYEQVNDLSADEFLCEELIIPIEVVMKIMNSVFYCRDIGGSLPSKKIKSFSVCDMLPKGLNLHVNREF